MAKKTQPKGKKDTVEPTPTPEKKSSFAESYGSTILGFVVVLILGSFLFNVFRGNNQNGKVGSGEETTKEEEKQASKTHKVEKGEDLWKIAAKEYGDGYKWTDIAKANNISDANEIEEGQELIIPDVSLAAPTEVAQAATPTTEPTKKEEPTITTNPTGEFTVTSTPAQQGEKGSEPLATGTSYEIVKGDTLWSIAVKEYNDGYKWVQIAKANKLSNPNVIHAGNTLAIPR